MEPQQLPLKDIHLPDTISWWPPAIGWWLVAISIPLICLLIIWIYKHITRQTAVKSAKKLLLTITQNTSSNDMDKLTELSKLMRRVAISQSPRAESASLSGQLWLQYLDKSVKGSPFTQGAGKVLADTHYQPSSTTDLDINSVIKLCKTWLQAQK